MIDVAAGCNAATGAARAQGVIEMVEERLRDCRPPRRGEGLTSASSHPELLTGDFAARPQINVQLGPEGRVTASASYRRALGICALVAVAMMMISMHRRDIDGVAGAHAEELMSLRTSPPGQDLRLIGSTGVRP